MKDFNDFLKYCSDNAHSVLYDSTNLLSDVPVDKRTITSEEWTLITKFILQSNFSLLRQYHNWLNEGLD